MIYLNIQLKLIIFSFSFGFFFSVIVRRYNKHIINKKIIYKLFITLLMMTVMSIIYFIGIYTISNAIFHIYSLLSILLGIVIYNVIIKK